MNVLDKFPLAPTQSRAAAFSSCPVWEPTPGVRRQAPDLGSSLCMAQSMCSVVPEMPSAVPSPQGSRARKQYAYLSMSPLSCTWGPYPDPGPLRVCRCVLSQGQCVSLHPVSGDVILSGLPFPRLLPVRTASHCTEVKGWMKSFGVLKYGGVKNTVTGLWG